EQWFQLRVQAFWVSSCKALKLMIWVAIRTHKREMTRGINHRGSPVACWDWPEALARLGPASLTPGLTRAPNCWVRWKQRASGSKPQTPHSNIYYSQISFAGSPPFRV